jgi:hypothetical protein
MKKIFTALTVFICVGATGFWWVFMKSEAVADAGMLSVCLNKNQLNVQSIESAKYIVAVENEMRSDTLNLYVKTTTVFNPFVKSIHGKSIELPVAVKFIKIAGKVVSADKLSSCQVNKIRLL